MLNCLISNIATAAYTMMTGRCGQLENMMPQLSNMGGNQGKAGQQQPNTKTSSQ